MNRTIVKLSILGLACTFSAAALAQVEVEPRVDIKPGDIDTVVKSTPKSGALKFNPSATKPNAATGATNTNPGDNSCPTTEVLAHDLAVAHPNSGVSEEDIAANIRSHVIQAGKCKHEITANGTTVKVDGPEGVSDDDAFGNLNRMGKEVRQDCPVGAQGAQLHGCWDQAVADVLAPQNPEAILGAIKSNCGGIDQAPLEASAGP